MGLCVFVVDDHRVVLDGIQLQLETAGMNVVGTAQCGKDAISQISELKIDVLLLDVRMPGMDGLATLESIRIERPDLPAVMFSAYDNPTYVARAVALGASDYLLKSAGIDEIQAAIRRAHQGEPAPQQSSLTRLHAVMQREIDVRKLPKDLPLTSREAQVLKHVALGLSNKEIAISLVISTETVKEHVQNVLRKINAKDRTDAAVRAIRAGLVDL